MAFEEVGPIEPSTHDSAVDKGRPDDRANLTTTRPADLLRPSAAKAPKLTPLEKEALNRLTGATMSGVIQAGGDQQAAEATGLAVRQKGMDILEEVTDRHIESMPGRDADFTLSRALDSYKFSKENATDRKNDATFMAQVAGGFMEFTLLPETWRWATRPEFEPDPTFDYMAGRDAVEAGFSNEDRQYLRESVSQADLEYRRDRLREKQMNMELIGAHGQGRAVVASLVGGFADPAGWVLGMGVGKAAQLVGVGARVAMQSGNTGRAIAYGSLEGAAGNLLYTGALDAAGAHTTNADYAFSAAFGVGFGLAGPAMEAAGRARGRDTAVPPTEAVRYEVDTEAFSVTAYKGDTKVGELGLDDLGASADQPLGRAGLADILVEEGHRRQGIASGMLAAARKHWDVDASSTVFTDDGARWAASTSLPIDDYYKELAASMREIQDAATATNYKLYTEAQAKAGADATPEQIAQVADEIMLDSARRAREIANAPVPDGERLYPTFDFTDFDPATGQIKSVLDAVGANADAPNIQARWGFTPEVVPDAARRAMLTAGAARVDDWAARNPVNEARLNSVMARVPWLASTGLQLARSQNNALRWVAGNLLENTTGATGSRTAAIDKAMLERSYLEHLNEFEASYRAWRGSQDTHPMVAAWKDIAGSDQRARFDRMVDQERRMRANGTSGGTDNIHVRRAADALDAGYERMRRDQVDVGTIGSARLVKSPSAGYAPRRINPAWVLNASNEQRQAFVEVLAKQLEGQWGDFSNGKQFARETAARYLDRAKTGAYGGVGIPANLVGTEGAEILRDTLRAMAVPEEDMAKLLGKFSRGGAGHTKGRLDLDLTQRVELGGGQSFDLADAFIQDQAALFNQYARRTSGEVALTKYGVMGEQGLKQLRELATFGPNKQRATPQELEAFDQVAAEFMGRAVGGSKATRYTDMLRMLTASSRLGGMFFTQFAESANGVGALGVKAVMEQISSIPKHIADIRAGRPSPLLESIELVGGPLGQDYKVIFPYQEAGDVRVYGRDSLNAMDRIVRAGANAVPWLSGWHHLHSAQIRGMSEQIVHKMARYIRDGKEDAALEGMGITKELAAAIRKELPRIAKFDDAGRLVELDITKAQNAEAMAGLVQSVHRGARQIIQGTYIGETGKWAHNDLLRVLTQFRSFSITAMEKQWTRQRVDYGTAKAFGLLMGSMSFALPIHMARVQINSIGREDRDEYLDQQLSLNMLGRATLNYASMSGLLGDILDSGAALAGYEMSGVRGGGKNFADNVPAIGYVNSTVSAVRDKDPRDMIRALPGGNLPWLMPIFNQAD